MLYLCTRFQKGTPEKGMKKVCFKVKGYVKI